MLESWECVKLEPRNIFCVASITSLILIKAKLLRNEKMSVTLFSPNRRCKRALYTFFLGFSANMDSTTLSKHVS